MTFIERPGFRGSTEIMICQTEAPHPQAVMVIDLIRHLAIIAAIPDGEDASGRQKCRIMTEDEVVARATKIADLAWKEFRARNWLLDVPVPKVETRSFE